MNPWQLSMAIGLTVQITFVVVMSWRTRRRYGWMPMPPRQRFFVRHGYLVALLPLGEAWILYCGGFWNAV